MNLPQQQVLNISTGLESLKSLCWELYFWWTYDSGLMMMFNLFSYKYPWSNKSMGNFGRVHHSPRPRGQGGMFGRQQGISRPPQCEWDLRGVIFWLSLPLQNPMTLVNGKDRWVYKMQDASAKWPRLGLLEGHQHFPGNFQSCLEIRTENNITGDGKHCMMLALPNVLAPEELKDKEQEIRRTIKGFKSQATLCPCKLITF